MTVTREQTKRASASQTGDDWIRDFEAVRQMFCRGAKKRVEQWRRVSRLVKSGRLTKQTGGWYRINDHKAALKHIGFLVLDMHLDSKTGKLARVKLQKPDRDTRALAAMAVKDH